MKSARLDEMKLGWFIGDFSPAILRTADFEVAVKSYAAGATEEKHLHKIAQEVTVILEGEAIMFNKRYVGGDIILVEPGEATGFRAVTPVRTLVVKIPSAPGDKYPAD